MADLIFPSLDGLDVSTTKTPIFNTALFNAISGKESRVALMPDPKFKFRVSFNFLTKGVDCGDEQDYQRLFGFFIRLQGRALPFLYEDPNDHEAIDQSFGAGNGATTTFRLRRRIGISADFVYFPKSVDRVAQDGTALTEGPDYSVSGSEITFTSAPPSGADLRWDGFYYHRCRMDAEGYELTDLFKKVAECRDIEFVGALWEAV